MSSVKVYSLEKCSYCESAKALLRDRGIAFSEVKVDRDNMDQLRELIQKTGSRTFPQIFIGEEFVGGYSDLQTLDRKGELVNKVNGTTSPGVGCCSCHGH